MRNSKQSLHKALDNLAIGAAPSAWDVTNAQKLQAVFAQSLGIWALNVTSVESEQPLCNPLDHSAIGAASLQWQ